MSDSDGFEGITPVYVAVADTVIGEVNGADLLAMVDNIYWIS